MMNRLIDKGTETNELSTGLFTQLWAVHGRLSINFDFYRRQHRLKTTRHALLLPSSPFLSN